MAEHERTKKRLETKIKKRNYTGYDDEEFADGQAGMRRAILAKYDEDLEGVPEMVCSLNEHAESDANYKVGLSPGQ